MNSNIEKLGESEFFGHTIEDGGCNHETRLTSWNELMMISRFLTNQFQCPSMEDGLVWLNDDGDDGSHRSATKNNTPAQFFWSGSGASVGCGHYSYAGIAEENVDTIEWMSSNSKSRLKAVKANNSWTLTLFQPNWNPSYHGWYQNIFATPNNIAAWRK